MKWYSLSIKEILKRLNTSKDGLSQNDAEKRLNKFGQNKLPEEKSFSSFQIFLEQFQSPLIYILLLAGAVTLILREFTDAIVILGAVILNTLVGFIQENKASKTLRELKKVVKYEAKVLREDNLTIINTENLVPGDIIPLGPGDKIPADGRLFECRNLKINEMALTGEWLAAEKKIKILPKKTPLADRDNMVYKGTVVEDGKGRAIVTETGPSTEIGKVAKVVRETREEKTPYQAKLAKFSKTVGIIVTIISLIIFIEGIISPTNLSFTERAEEMFTTSVAVAVAAIPEGLPVAMTIILAVGMQRILRQKGLVRKLVSAETLGSTSIICTDKTGTLTEGKMKVTKILTPFETLKNKKDKKGEELVLKTAMFCIEAFVQNPEAPKEKWFLRGRPTDKSLLEAGIKAGLDKKELEKNEPKIEELPFDPVYKYSATLRSSAENKNMLYVLGAPEIILSMSTYLDIKGKQKISLKDTMDKINKAFETSAQRGYRVLAVANKQIKSYKKFTSPKIKDKELEKLCNNLNFLGFIILSDPLRKETKESIRICRRAGIRPIIVTGDHKLTAKAIAEQLKLPAKESNIIEGRELTQLTDKEFKEKLTDITIFARVEPIQKLRIVKAWQDRGEVVAMTGDGINDAPALKKADIGLALGSGTQVAKEVSDLILLTDNFSIIIAAVEEGRAIIDNIRKVMTYLLADSFTEIILIGVSILAGVPLPISAVQILWVNLAEDGLPDTALAFEEKEKDLMKQKPQSRYTPLLTREMKAIIFIIGAITDLMILGLFFWLFNKFGAENIAYIRTMIFASLSIDSLFYVFSCKSLKRNVWDINPFSNKLLTISVAVGILMLLTAVYLPVFQSLLKTVPLNTEDWLIILGLGVIEIVLIEITKWYFISRKITSK